ncbi:MAG TPA: hypothetical protein VHQ46_02145 [Desulfobacteria bacterium]|nr:hypothetical protein [Desulfobacteria bacterium]
MFATVAVICIAIILICSVVISLLTVKTTSVTATADFHYLVQANGRQFDLVPADVLRIERTSAKKSFTGQPIEILKVYTTKGFIYASPNDDAYQGVSKLANSVDFYGLQTWTKSDTSWEDIRSKAYAIGTPTEYRAILFAVLGVQNIACLATGFALIALIFPLRSESQEDTTPVVKRLEQLA